MFLTFGIVSADNHPGMIGPGEISERVIHLAFVAQQAGHGCFRPQNQIGFVGQSVTRESNQLAKTLVISGLIPNESLGNAWLNESHAQRSRGLIAAFTMADFVGAPGE